MSRPSRPDASGDYIVTVDPSIPSSGSGNLEKPANEATALVGRRSSDAGDTMARQRDMNNMDLDGAKQEKSKFQLLKPVLFRLVLLLVPAGLLAIPIIFGFTHGRAVTAHIGGVWIRWFFIWVEIFWCSIWLSNITAKYVLPHIARILIGIFSKKAKIYHYVITELEVPLTLCGWAFASFISFRPIMHGHDPKPTNINWRTPTSQVLAGLLVSSAIYLVKSLMIQVVYIRYRQHQLADKVERNKESLEILTRLYSKSREIHPDGTDVRLYADDEILAEAISFAVNTLTLSDASEEKSRRSQASARVIWALEHRRTAGPSLAKRIWFAFVGPSHTSLFPADLQPHFEPEFVARSFAILDKDENGDITLSEVISDVADIARERRDLYSGWSDSQDIIANFSILCDFVVIGLSILVFLAFLTSIKNTFWLCRHCTRLSGFCV
ncbi:hypothetical protein TWF481_010352 [Arthrobotrys musiformis]|uniref:EF-hand domain-containing protein n=1 Tax=Arthrobotrys musiformis TaxID=47236 RepID=A0AAV9W1P0_9PEZI